MKNDVGSTLNKLGGLNAEVVKLTKKVDAVEPILDKFDKSLKEESMLRQNIEKKTYYMGEDLSKRIDSVKSDIDLINSNLNEQLSDMKRKVFDELNKTSGNLLKNFEESIRRLEDNEAKTHKYSSDLASFKIENAEKIASLEHLLSEEVKEIRRELANNSLVLLSLEQKVNDSILSMSRDIREIVKDLNLIKFEVETVKNFKENTLISFKDIGDEFLKNEEIFRQTTQRINQQIREFEGKIIIFEQGFKLNNESFANIKKDVYSQIYDSNLNMNNKIQIFSDTLNHRFEGFDRVISEFQSNLMDENYKFTNHVAEQIESTSKGFKKLLQLVSEDVDLLKTNVKNFESLAKNLRNEFHSNLSNLESSMLKKIDDLHERNN